MHIFVDKWCGRHFNVTARIKARFYNEKQSQIWKPDSVRKMESRWFYIICFEPPVIKSLIAMHCVTEIFQSKSRGRVMVMGWADWGQRVKVGQV